MRGDALRRKSPDSKSSASITGVGGWAGTSALFLSQWLTCPLVHFTMVDSYLVSAWPPLSLGHAHKINLFSGKGSDHWPNQPPQTQVDLSQHSCYVNNLTLIRHGHLTLKVFECFVFSQVTEFLLCSPPSPSRKAAEPRDSEPGITFPG